MPDTQYWRDVERVRYLAPKDKLAGEKAGLKAWQTRKRKQQKVKVEKKPKVVKKTKKAPKKKKNGVKRIKKARTATKSFLNIFK